jgi:lipopolysaccharide/colanic/teichoic acid biosynthesis glycosyltransferase
LFSGITGLWQVSGRSNTSYDYRIALDSWYARNWNLWLDIVILFKTLRVVLRREGAY